MDRRPIALFLRSLGGGGVQRSMLLLAGGLVARGCAVDLVVCQGDGAFRDKVPAGVRLVTLAGGPSLAGRVCALKADAAGWRDLLRPVLLPHKTSWQLRYLPALVRYLRREQPSVIVTGGAYLALSALWARRLAAPPTRVIVSERGNLSNYLFYGRTKRKWRFRFLLPLLRRTFPRADGFVAVSHGVGDDLASLLGIARERITTVYNPVVTPELDTMATADPDHPWLAPGAPPVILGVGRLVDQKDFATLLKAFARIRQERDARLIVLGEGKRRRELEQLVEELRVADSVALPGFAANPFAFMARAAVFALSSASEGLPGVLIQAMACGCPVVSTDCPDGPREILKGGALGPLVPVGDDEALARAIVATLDHPPDREALRRRAREFSVDRATDGYLEVLARAAQPDVVRPVEGAAQVAAKPS